jgi:phospholipase C
MIAAAARILVTDGKRETYHFLQQQVRQTTQPVTFLQGVQRGSLAADGGILPLSHYHHPFRHTGFGNYRRSAADVAVTCYGRAVDYYRQGQLWSAAFNLGLALHMLHDVHVPHHAALMGVFIQLGIDPHGHYAYESWLSSHWQKFIVSSGGRYSWQGRHYHPDYGVHRTSAANVYDWIDEAAALGFSYIEHINKKDNPVYEDNFPAAASVLIPHTLRWTAGFIHKYVEEVKNLQVK